MLGLQSININTLCLFRNTCKYQIIVWQSKNAVCAKCPITQNIEKMQNVHILRSYFVGQICSDWIITKNANIQSFIWATMTKLGMWVDVDSSITHVFCCWCAYKVPHLHICSDWLNTKKCKYPEFCMGYSDESWYIGSSELKCYPSVKYYPCTLLL